MFKIDQIKNLIGYDKDGQELSLYDIIPQNEEDDPGNIVEKKVLVEEIKDYMKANLSEREYKIICLRYGLIDHIERTQQEVAEIMEISRSYISRIETKALQVLKEKFGKQNLNL